MWQADTEKQEVVVFMFPPDVKRQLDGTGF